MNRREFLCLSGSALAACATGRIGRQSKALAAGERVFAALLEKARSGRWAELPMGALVGEIGKSLIGTPYVGQTLETSDTVEVCVVNLEGLDCVTFFESSLGFARMLKSGGSTPDDLVRQITQTRYRGGVLDGYVSRLHYTSEWFADNAKRGMVRDLTAGLPGAVRFDKRIHFMSSHPELYRQLKTNPDWVKAIAQIEARLTASTMWHVPRGRVAEAEPLLQTGDIVGITTSTEGIDCSHTGLCFRDGEGDLRFLHASSAEKKVVLGPRLSAYVLGGSKNLGVMVARGIEDKG